MKNYNTITLKLRVSIIIVLTMMTLRNFAQKNTFPVDGKVGIGILTPHAKLHIKGTGGWESAIQIDDTNGRKFSLYSMDGKFCINDETSYKNRIVINDKGFVAIGTSNPKYPLTVKGIINAEANGDYYGAWFGGEARTSTPSINVGSWYNNRGSMFWDTASKKLKFETCNNSEQSFQNTLVMYNGMVGIGTTDTKGFKLAVNGSISATEIKVEAQTADFVFEPDYKLRPLNEVEAFVKTNKHLPEIPSAKQMEADGVNVAEMNKLLLQKVEELTLYTIQQQKELRLKNTELELFKRRLLKLESIVSKLK